jgi:dihydrofolate reductase
MRKVKLNLAVSLDGFIEGPNGEYDWCFTDQDYGLTEFYKNVDAIFYGRKSWELFGSFTPPENASGTEKKIFDMISSKKSYVFSRTLKYVKGAVLINNNVEEEVKKLKQQEGKDIHLFGGAGLITTFVNADLIDEYLLAVHPIILGAGKPLFKDIKERKKLKLVDSKAYQTGLVMLTYKPEK